MKPLIKATILFLFILFSVSVCYGQYMAGYPMKINNLELNKIPVNKESVVSALGTCTNYYTVDLSDEYRGIDEYYLYKDSETHYLHMTFNNGEITAFDCTSPSYLIFGNLRVGESIQNLKSMLSNGFGRVYMEELLDDASRRFHITLGDNYFYVRYKDDIIISIHYAVSI